MLTLTFRTVLFTLIFYFDKLILCQVPISGAICDGKKSRGSNPNRVPSENPDRVGPSTRFNLVINNNHHKDHNGSIIH